MTGADENSPLLDAERASDRRLSRLIQKDDAASSIVKSHASVDEQALADSTIGERLAYNDYTTIDWLHDLVSFMSLSLCLCLYSSSKSRRADVLRWVFRSKIPTVSAISTVKRTSEEKHLRSSMHLRDG
jgi:hypothetical protein